tara:strand:+ start:30689 stop:31177 length:489 start_codon:yes stop_codon:yes gene_type:complete
VKTFVGEEALQDRFKWRIQMVYMAVAYFDESARYIASDKASVFLEHIFSPPKYKWSNGITEGFSHPVGVASILGSETNLIAEPRDRAIDALNSKSPSTQSLSIREDADPSDAASCLGCAIRMPLKSGEHNFRILIGQKRSWLVGILNRADMRFGSCLTRERL